MKKFIYIAVGIILITSLMPTMNYSAPASFLEITIESPEASPEMLLQAEDVISKRLEAYGITAFETEIHPEEREIDIRFREALAAEKILPLLTSVGRLEFCEVYTQPEVFSMLNESAQSEAWKQWAPLNDETGSHTAVIATIALEEAPAFGRFVLDQEAFKIFPANLSFTFSRTPDENGQAELYALRYGKRMTPILTGAAVEHCQAYDDEAKGVASVSLTFNEEGSARWAQATRENMHRPIAIVFDGQVCFAPRVMAEIKSGQAQISGDFSSEEARQIAALIQGGELPAPFRAKVVKP
ncbi:MAG: hypothetical protein H6573_29330 [Lewinellaceae bacterium]|nr:hypothetical protein [Lewinellaceae bacterium]